MKKKLLWGSILIVALSVMLSGCFLMPKASLESGNYYLVTSFNDWSENPTILKNYEFEDNQLTVDTSEHATFLYYVVKAGANGEISERYGSKDAPVFAYGKEDSTFYVKPSMMKNGEIVGTGDNTKNDKDFYFHGNLNSWGADKMEKVSDGATLTYTTTIVPKGFIEFKITVAATGWIDAQTFNGHWNGVGNNMKMKLSEDASEVTIEFNPLTDFATMTYTKSASQLTPDYYIVGSLNGWSTDDNLILLSDDDGDGIFTAATSTTTGFTTSDKGVVEYKVIKKINSIISWYGLGNHFFSATPTSVNFFMELDSDGNHVYGTDMDAMDDLPLAVAGDFNGWSDTEMKIEGTTYKATIDGNFQAKDYGLKIKKPGTWDSYQYPNDNYTATLSEAASEITVTFDPKTWNISLTKVK